MATKPNVVCIGGGTGLPVILRGLKREDINITAIVTVTDDGGSSGRLRNEMAMPPPGDIRNVILSLSEREPLLIELLQYRFKNGNDLAGHPIGNLLIAALKDITGSFSEAIKELSRVLAVKGLVLPASTEIIELKAELFDGNIITGETNISSFGKQIKKVFLNPSKPKAYEDTLEALNKADLIVIGPGSLYTSILPSLLVSDIASVIKKSSSSKLYICNIMTQKGETDNYKASDHIKSIYNHLPINIDICVINKELPKLDIKHQYANQRLVFPDIDEVEKLCSKVVTENLLFYDKVLRHDSNKLTNIIMEHLR